MKTYGDVDEWREEYYFKLQDCKNATMDDCALSHAFNGQTFKQFMEKLIGTHGLENVFLLLSSTIRESSWDGLYSCEVKTWANRYPAIQQPPEEQKEPVWFSALYLNEHLVVLNQAARIVIQKEKELARHAGKEPEQ